MHANPILASLCTRSAFVFKPHNILKFSMRVWKHVISDVTFLWREGKTKNWVLDYTLKTKFVPTFLLRFQVEDYQNAADVAANDCCVFFRRFGSVVLRSGVQGTRWVRRKVVGKIRTRVGDFWQRVFHIPRVVKTWFSNNFIPLCAKKCVFRLLDTLSMQQTIYLG